MKLSDVDLLSLQTMHMQKDRTTQALCAAFTPQFQQLANEVRACLIYARIDELVDDILDEVAWQMHVDWYDPKADIAIKRQLIKKSIRVHRYRGTPFAVEEVLQDYFDDAEVKEWFEYGGDPYKFKVIVRNQAVGGELADRFTMALNSVKNLRSHMEEIVFGLFCSDTIYCSDSLIII